MGIRQIKGVLLLVGINSIYFLWEYSKFGSNLFRTSLTGSQMIKVGAIAKETNYYSVFTSLLGHLSFEHFLGNMIVLLLVGSLVELMIGTKKTLFLYFFSGIITNVLLYYVLDLKDKVSIGSSLSVYSLIGFFTIYLLASFKLLKTDKQKRIVLMMICFILIGSFFIINNNNSYSINVYGHLISFFIGSVIGILSIKIFNRKEIVKNLVAYL